jgi:1-deoxy-D-xylulose-5-phosphate reductoisomerase
MKRSLVLLGSTGSIGESTLAVVRSLRRTGVPIDVRALSAKDNLAKFQAQIREFRPQRAVLMDPDAAAALRAWARRHAPRLRVFVGSAGLDAVASAPGVDIVLSAVVGAVGLSPLVAALRAGKKVALANKEALIVAGELLSDLARRHGAELLPVDSEHSAIFQCLGGRAGRDVERLILTASGGAFYRRTDPLDDVTPEEALNHPTWKMGKKITVDCATLTNKGLEAIEAHYLFGVPMDKIDIVIHPQSIVHSLVEFADGAMLAQLSHPDMRLPIQYALTYPDRRPTGIKPLRLHEIETLTFHHPDFRRFPCLALTLEAGRRGGLWPAVLNGANETAVRRFLDGKIKFTAIARVLGGVLRSFARTEDAARPARRLEDIFRVDRWARMKADSLS